MIEYLFDENLSHSYADSLNVLEKSRGDYIVQSTKRALHASASDEEIVNYATTKNHTVIILAQDRDFRKRNLYTLIMKSRNVGLFLINFPKGYKFWDQVQFIYKQWIGIRDIANNEKPPFSYKVSYRKIEKL